MDDKILQVPLMGRLGNQLFIYAAARAISLKQNRKMFFSDYDYTLWHNDNRLDCFILSDDVVYLESLTCTTKQKVGNFIYRVLCRNKDVNQVARMEKKNQWVFHMFDMFMCQEGYLAPTNFKCNNLFVFGYFQSSKYFMEYEDIIRKELEFKTEIFNEEARALGKFIANIPKSVCIHIRRGDYLNNPVFNVCNTEYYYRAIDCMKILVPDAHYFVFSDKIDEVKGLFSKYSDLEFSYIDSRYTDQESMFLGSCCRHFIISNSTFSWWMQYLSDNKDKIVLAPNKWYNTDNPCDIYQDNWRLIKV